MRNFDQLSNIKYRAQYGTTVLEMEIGSVCIFNQSAPCNGVHVHNCFEISYVTRGTGVFVSDGIIYQLSRGDVFIADSNVVHEIRVDNDNKGNRGNKDKEENRDNKGSELEIVYLLFNVIEQEDTNSSGYNEGLLWSFLNGHSPVAKKCRKIEKYLTFIGAYEVEGKGDQNMIIQTYMLLLLEMIRCLCTEKVQEETATAASKRIIDTAMMYIRENISSRIYVGAVAKHAKTSVRNLQYLFGKHLNMTVVHYIHLRKINLACSLLKMNISVSETARMIGINDVSQFSVLFKKIMNMSPREYQNKNDASGVHFGAVAVSSEKANFSTNVNVNVNVNVNENANSNGKEKAKAKANSNVETKEIR